jgi:hypothetical protein
LPERSKNLFFPFWSKHMKLNLIVAAAALAAAGVAHAGVDNMASGNSSIAFIAFDNTTTTGQSKVGSVFIDLGVNVNDFFPTVIDGFTSNGNNPVTMMELSNTNLAASATTAVWNFGTSSFSLTRQGQTVASPIVGTVDWSSFAAFTAGIDSAMKWAVIGGDSTTTIGGNRGDVQGMLTTGTPTATNLTAQNGSATANMGTVDTLFNAANNNVTNADNGSYYTSSSSDALYVPNTGLFSANWQNNLKWVSTVDTKLSTTNTTAASAKNLTQTNFYALTGEGSELQVGKNSGAANAALLNNKGTWTLDVAAKTLTWSTPIPEPESYALVIAGLAVMAGVARRRAAK